jgi:hypothetical protein
MSTGYDYSISGAFPNGRVNVNTLTTSIEGSSITGSLEYITTTDNTCSIWFTNALSSGDKATLDALVGAHTGNPEVYIHRLYGESVKVSSTTSDTFIDKLAIKSTDFEDGAYCVQWYAEVSMRYYYQNRVRLRVLCDSSEIASNLIWVYTYAGDAWYPASGFACIDFTGPSHDVCIQFASQIRNYDVHIRNARIEIRKVGS